MTRALAKIRAFEAFGIELEYMICDAKTLNVLPITDKLFYSVNQSFDGEVDRGVIAWNNELALHVVELKTDEPCKSLLDILPYFQTEVRAINKELKAHGGTLLPSAMHPWMDPLKELKLWPHGENPWYSQFDAIFNCKGHGWANLQSMHINLPFGNEEEFVKLHAVIRLVLPLIPALAASSPFMDGMRARYKDARLAVYQNNSKKIPSITGDVIPETVLSIEQYDRDILQRIWNDLEGEDRSRVLVPEWTNARGAITRFERNTIEIRLIDVQETPLADLSIAALLMELIRKLFENFDPSFHNFTSKELKAILDATIQNAEEALIENSSYLALFTKSRGPVKANVLWREIAAAHPLPEAFQKTIQEILERGTLATRLIRAVGEIPTPESLKKVYEKLTECLDKGALF